MLQPECDLFEPEIEPNLYESCQISALFRTGFVIRNEFDNCYNVW